MATDHLACEAGFAHQAGRGGQPQGQRVELLVNVQIHVQSRLLRALQQVAQRLRIEIRAVDEAAQARQRSAVGHEPRQPARRFEVGEQAQRDQAHPLQPDARAPLFGQ